LGNGDGTFQNATRTSLDGVAFSIAVGDFNLDGKADVIFDGGWYDVALMIGNGDGTLQPPLHFHSTTPSWNVVSADFDGNSSPDIAVGGGNRVTLMLNALGSRSPAAVLSPSSISFGNVSVGQTSSPQTVTLTYNANTSLTMTGITISGAQASEFSESNSCGMTLAAGASCEITATFTPTATGSRSASIRIIDDASNTPQIVTLNGTGATLGFGVPAGGSSSETVPAGQTVSYTLSIGGTGLSGTAGFTCTGAPQGATCKVPPSVNVNGTMASKVNVSVSTTSRTTATMNPPGTMRLGGLCLALALGLCYVPTARRKRNSTSQYFSPILGSLLLIASCGGSSGPKTNPEGTPAGTYNLTVTATMTQTNETVKLTLIVQ
jgi:centrosomal CEP192-like protein